MVGRRPHSGLPSRRRAQSLKKRLVVHAWLLRCPLRNLHSSVACVALRPALICTCGLTYVDFISHAVVASASVSNSNMRREPQTSGDSVVLWEFRWFGDREPSRRIGTQLSSPMSCMKLTISSLTKKHPGAEGNLHEHVPEEPGSTWPSPKGAAVGAVATPVDMVPSRPQEKGAATYFASRNESATAQEFAKSTNQPHPVQATLGCKTSQAPCRVCSTGPPRVRSPLLPALPTLDYTAKCSTLEPLLPRKHP